MIDLDEVRRLMMVRDHHLLNSAEVNRMNLFALADAVPDLVGEIMGLQRYVRELCHSLYTRRAMEPRHSDPEHECPECVLLAEIKPERYGLRPACQHEWVDMRNKVVESGEMCKKCGAIR